jgi:predicted rRNA methylase YqxC with S4 and FtsJ domains
MFNDEYIKLESQLLIIDIMMKSIDEILKFLRNNMINNAELTAPINRIFKFCKKIIETIPQFNIQTPVSRNQLLNSIEIIQKYWDEQDTDLFVLNWFLFSAQWSDFSDELKNKLSQNRVYYFSLN